MKFQPADISTFTSLMNGGHTSLSIFNSDVDDIKNSVQEWMDQIDTLRELQADAEAEAEESKLEGVLASFDDRIQSSIRSARTMITELKRSGALDQSETEDVASEESELPTQSEEDFADFDSLLGGEEGGGTEEMETDGKTAKKDTEEK